MLSPKSVLVLSVLAAASFNAAACYTVFDRGNRVVYQGEQAPVDMSLPLKEALQSRFPGGHMVFEQTNRCEPVALAQQLQSAQRQTVASVPDTSVMGAGPANGRVTRSAAAAVVPASPMLTDRNTALSMNVPYRVLAGNIVVVPAAAAATVSMPNMTIVPGARPTPVAARGTQTVITEMRNPPMTVIQRGGEVVVAPPTR